MFLFLLGLALCNGAVISVIEACRHGARSPIDNNPWDTGYWNEGYGELTQEGMRQQYLNGAEFRNRYIINQQVAGAVFNASEIYVRSTNVNRTIMSAESQLMGFYPNGPNLSSAAMEAQAVPPFNVFNQSGIINSLGLAALPNNFQPIPIHVVASPYDNMLNGYSAVSCPYINVIASMVQSSSQYQYRVYNYTAYLQKQLYTVFGEMIPFETAGWYADNLVCDQFHGYPMVPGITEDMYQQMMGIMNYSNSYFFQYGGAQLASSQFYSAVIDTFEGVINGSSTLTWSLYSAHDTTLIGFLIAIDNWDNNNPPFASSLVFELNEINDNYFVSISYNDNPLTLNGCVQMCPFEEFKQLLLEWIIPDVVAQCNSNSEIDTSNLIHNPFTRRFT